MTIKVKLEDIMDTLDFNSDEWLSLINKETGNVVFVSLDGMRAAEDEDPYDDLPEWQREERMLAIDIVENEDKYISTPTTHDWNEYDVMERFCWSILNNRLQNAFLHAITGKGAFRRFKDKLMENGMENEWYTFRDENMKEFVREWCKERGIEYIE